MKKQKRKVFFSIGGDGMQNSGQKVAGGRFTKGTRNHKAKICNNG